MRVSGEKFGPYELVGRLAALDTSEVYLARQDGEPRALKIFRPEVSKRPFIDMLARERPSALEFRHPAAAALFKAGPVDKRAVIASEFAWGQPWAAVVRRTLVAGLPLGLPLVRWIGAQIASALDLAHRTQWTTREEGKMFHGRIALGHVLLTYSGEVKVVGVGVGRSMAMLPVSPSKLPYRAPEQARGETTSASDVYSLGVCLYDAFSGKTLFKRGTPEATLDAIARAKAPPLDRQVPPEIAALIARMMALDPKARPPAAEVAAALLKGPASVERCRFDLSARMMDLFPAELKSSQALREEAFAGGTPERYLMAAQTAHSLPPPVRVEPELPEMPASFIAPNFASVPSYAALRDSDVDLDATIEDEPAQAAEIRAEIMARIVPINQVRAHQRGGSQTGGVRVRPDPREIKVAAPRVYAAPKIGELVGSRYEIVQFLGKGGMALVYRVRHAHLEKDMALKLLKPEAMSVPGVIERFEREARASARLDHENIVRVTDFGRSEGNIPFFVMELLPGPSLSAIIAERGKTPAAEAIRVIDDVLAGLAHAHAQGVVHRDMKPENVMMAEKDGQPIAKILDFGIAQVRSGGAGGVGVKLTQPGMTLGTPTYMAPEQAVGDETDARSDIYTVGVMLYELLTGKTPFSGGTPVEVMTRVVTQQPPPLVAPHLAERERADLEAIILRALAKRKDDRFKDAEEMRRALAAHRPVS